MVEIASLSAALVLHASFAPTPPRFDDHGRAIGAPLSDRVVSYEIDAQLDPGRQTLTGTESLVWRNTSAEPQGTLWFHLYWNAFKNNRSSFYRDARLLGGARDLDATEPDFPKRAPDEWGYTDLKALAVHGGEDLLPSLRYQHPDDDNADDRTVFTVTLGHPVPPGGSVSLDIRWEARVPKLVERAGRQGNFYLMGQWFPKVGVLEVPPVRGVKTPTWNCHQYHADTEFYADFGSFDVKMTVPRAMKVGATGVRTERTEGSEGTVSYRYHQDDVHDFAWTAWEGFDESEDVFSENGLPEVKITYLLDPKRRASDAQARQAIHASLLHYGQWWTPWPYSHLTLVDPPVEAIAASGMEYPTFITIDTRADPAKGKDYLMWQTIAHEFGHNYWYGLVASNEFEEAWLDEGINTYGTAKLCLAEGVSLNLQDLVPRPLRWFFTGMPSMDDHDLIATAHRVRWSSPVILPGWKYRTLSDYSGNSYSRTAANLFALESELGPETMQKVMRTYAERWKFKHPRSEDFFAVAQEVSGRDLSWFWDEFFHGTGGVDYVVDTLECVPRPASRVGIFDSDRGRETLPAPGAAPEDIQDCAVEVSRVGEVRLPLTVDVTFEDGETRQETWDGKGRWMRWTYERSGKGGSLKQVQIRATGALELDATPANDSRTSQMSAKNAISVFGWFTYVGELLTTLASWVD
jgi:hypothetical protein